MLNYGKVNLTLDEYLKTHKISRSSLVRETGLQYGQVLKYCRNSMQKVDLIVLAKLCTALKCQVEDLLKFTEVKIDKNN